MRNSSHNPLRLARAVVVASIVLAASCGGGTSSSIPNGGNNNAVCDFNAQSISLARTPSAGQNTIEIVSSTGADDLHGNPASYDLNLRDSFNNLIVTGALSLVPDNSGPHPYTNDFYYSGTLQTAVQAGVTYSVYLNVPNSGCQPGFVGTFGT
ncbi:MAG: hypothetical protein M3M96_00555 [Candidatus Eremiobacteraeota bacterium]|nr:hypothetical protein [Candidatus Eremiobacteraeota bacterium]